MSNKPLTTLSKRLPQHFEWSADQLLGIEISQRLRRCPPFLCQLVEKAVEIVDPNKVWIFGSRARGDHRKLSDYDLAFDVSPEMIIKWTDFAVEKKDSIQTLLPQDWILFSSAPSGLKKQILKEGILIYEKVQK